MRIDFLDEDGFISIINPDKYQGFVDEDWQLNQLMQHFVNQMNSHAMIIWASNEYGGDEWHIEVLNQPSDKKEFRHFVFPINVTSNLLYLSPYNDLTMAAQFKDIVIPLKHNSHLKIDISNGSYEVTIRQMFDPKSSDHYLSDITDFEIIFKKISELLNQPSDKIFWWT